MICDHLNGLLQVRIDGASTWSVIGELDLQTAPLLVDTARRQAPVPELTLRLDQLRFLDVAGWHALRDVHEIIGADRALHLEELSRPALRVLGILGIP